MTGIVFIRHAQTAMSGTFCGHSDPPIDERGRQQVDELIERLSYETFDATYSSDLRRAVDTATPLAQALAVPIVTTPRLREIHFGEWEGLTWSEIEQRDAKYARRWIETFPSLSAPGGEPFAAFERRVLDEVDAILALAVDRRIAVVTHAGVMRVVLRARMGLSDREAWEMTQPYCASFVCDGLMVTTEASR
jgi:alpha-ribazole phosphatase/probable phosphoglycerate mutase